MKFSLDLLTASSRQNTTPPFSDNWQSNEKCKISLEKEAPPPIDVDGYTLVLTSRKSLYSCVILAAQDVANLTSCCPEGKEVFILLSV